MHRTILALMAILSVVLLTGCVTHVHRDYPSWRAYQAAHPNAQFVVLRQRPARGGTCWKAAYGWRCVAR